MAFAPERNGAAGRSAHQGWSLTSTTFDTADSVLASIYDRKINLAVWQRRLADELDREVDALFLIGKPRPFTLTVHSQGVLEALSAEGDIPADSQLARDIAGLAGRFCRLFDRDRLGLRVTVLEHAMCPRFHVDNVICRMLTTYGSVGTEWLPNDAVDRSKLGRGNLGKPDHESGIYRCASHIQGLLPGYVACLKGERWQGNRGRGLVHRSPELPENGRRLVLSLDLV
ncbi:MAG: DUF1826 domain-containing protein [Pseudomonadota bacterium]